MGGGGNRDGTEGDRVGTERDGGWGGIEMGERRDREREGAERDGGGGGGIEMGQRGDRESGGGERWGGGRDRDGREERQRERGSGER